MTYVYVSVKSQMAKVQHILGHLTLVQDRGVSISIYNIMIYIYSTVKSQMVRWSDGQSLARTWPPDSPGDCAAVPLLCHLGVADKLELLIVQAQLVFSSVLLFWVGLLQRRRL